MIKCSCDENIDSYPIYDRVLNVSEDIKAQYDELIKNQEALKISEERYRLAVEGANDALWDWDFINNKFFISDKWKKNMGYKLDTQLSIIGKISRLVHPDDIGRVMGTFREYLSGIKPYYICEFRIKYDDKGYMWVLSRGKLLRNKEKVVIRMAGSLSDITKRKKYEEKIKNMAYFDPLTKFPNFHLFQEHLCNVIKNYNKDFKFSVFLIDIDNFRNINDTLGHKFGDKVLIKVGNNLKKFLDKDDNIYRMGEDEFLVVKAYLSKKNQVEKYAYKLLNWFRNSMIVDLREVYVNITIGIGIYPYDGKDAYTLFKNVDSAMYSAKEHGKNRYEFFDKNMSDRILKRSFLELNLRRAVKNNEFILYYQPQMNLETGKIVGVEALIRWKHPKMGIIYPTKFIPLAESTGLILSIGKWVLENACFQNTLWQKLGYNYIVVAVNVSALQIQQTDFIDIVRSVLKDTNMNPKFLEIEITESILMTSIDENIKKLKKLKDMGIKISLDDFGTGYSSLSYLRKLPIDTLKIDKCFIDDIISSNTDEGITGEIIRLAHKLGINVIAEGVEKDDQVKFLKSKKCDKIQGYILSKPVGTSKIEKYFNT